MDSLNELKLMAVELTGLAKDALHIYVALAVFLGACLIFRWRASEWKPLLLVLIVALIGEIFDMRYNSTHENDPFIFNSIHDIWNTMLVPFILFSAARFTPVFAPKGKTEPDKD